MSAPQDRAGVVRVMAKGMIAPHLDITNYPGVVLDARNALAALEAAGMRVVPASVVEGLRSALSNLLGIAEDEGIVGDRTTLAAAHRALDDLAASPFAPPPQEETTDAG